MDAPFVPVDFEVPRELEGPGFRLEPLGPHHNDRDHHAWMSSIEHIRSTPGFDDPDADWPVAMDLEANMDDLVMHADHFERRVGFTYSVLDGDEVIGCLYIYPSKDSSHDARTRSWVTASRAHMDGVVRETVANWLDHDWPFTNPAYDRAG